MVNAAVHPAMTASTPNSRLSSAIRPTRGRSRNNRNAPKSDGPAGPLVRRLHQQRQRRDDEGAERKRPQPDRDAVDAKSSAEEQRGDQRAGGAKGRHQRKHRAPALAVGDRDQRVAGCVDGGAAGGQQDGGDRRVGCRLLRRQAGQTRSAISRLPSDSTRWQPTRSTRLPAIAVKTNWPAKKTTSSRACAATSKPSAPSRPAGQTACPAARGRSRRGTDRRRRAGRDGRA